MKTSHLKTKYQYIAWAYDVLDWPWERMYQPFRKAILRDVDGLVLELGAGTGHNFPFYKKTVTLTAIELSSHMLNRAKKRRHKAKCTLTLRQMDACELTTVPDNYYDWAISTFMFCVMPDKAQQLALNEMARVLKPGGQFKLIEMVYSKKTWRNYTQQLLTPIIEKLYGARFDRQTVEKIKTTPLLSITHCRFLKDDVYLLIEGKKLS